jgi:hypothetical protein
MNLPDDVSPANPFFWIEDEPPTESDPYDRPDEEDEDE